MGKASQGRSEEDLAMKFRLYKKHYLFFSILIFCLLTTSLYGQNLQGNCSDFLEYQVRKGDTISSIAVDFGSSKFEKLIIDSNNDQLYTTNILSQDQVLRIPTKIYHFKNLDLSIQDVLSNPLCDSSSSNKNFKIDIEALSGLQEADTTETENLEEFREAFQSLVEEERRDSVQEKEQAEAEQQLFLELDGLVLDETRSKIGRDFYDIFYQKWEAPPNSSNYTITISEKPTPTLGSFISVGVNDQQIFQYRLQPRYEIIQQVAEYAVRVTYMHMKNNQHQYIIY